MFQNIIEEKDEVTVEENNQNNKKEIIKKIFKIQNILMYILSFMISTVSSINGMAPFGLAIFAAAISNGAPAIGIFIAALLGTVIGFGINGVLTYIVTSLILIAMILAFKPWYEDEHRNERRKIGRYVIISTILVQFIQVLFKGFLIYDIFLAIVTSVITYIFYKIFANSISVISEYNIKKAFTVEEVVGASLMLSIATIAFGDFSILGFEIKTVLSIFIVLVLGWKKGILIGATSGITIGAVLGVIGNGEPVLVATFALSGMIAGILSRFGRIGVIIRIYIRKYHIFIYYKWKYNIYNIYKRNFTCIIRSFVSSKKCTD